MTTEEFKLRCCDLISAVMPINLADVDALIELFYAMPGNAAGGTLHIVLDDSNWETEHIEWCMGQARAAADIPAFFRCAVAQAFTVGGTLAAQDGVSVLSRSADRGWAAAMSKTDHYEHVVTDEAGASLWTEPFIFRRLYRAGQTFIVEYVEYLVLSCVLDDRTVRTKVRRVTPSPSPRTSSATSTDRS